VIRVLVVDDQALVRGGFRLILDAQKDMEVVGEAATGREALDSARELQPDVVLMDVRMPDIDGIQATRALVVRDDQARVLMLTTFDADQYVYDAMKAGASGFLLKDVRPEQLAEAVRVVARGEALLAAAITRRLVEQFVRRPPPGSRAPKELEDLTERELDVLKLVAHGTSNAEIASDLFVSEATVKTHITHILTKLGLRDRVQAVVLAYESGPCTPVRSTAADRSPAVPAAMGNASRLHAAQPRPASPLVHAELLVLAVLGVAVEEAIEHAGKAHFAGKVLIDATNPLDFSQGFPPGLAWGHTDSGGEHVQRAVPDAKVVKAFNIIGNAHFAEPRFPDGQPTMLIAGNDDDAKATVNGIVTSFGWPPAVDVGGIEAARELEALCILWVRIGGQRGAWDHGFALLTA
jgi:DNA-binding NarL/FixJ family response regulator/predicted dinucleotide-binding enzyme